MIFSSLGNSVFKLFAPNWKMSSIGYFRIAFLFIFFWVAQPLLAQKTSDKSDMEAERRHLQRELRQIQESYDAVKGQSKNSLMQLAALNKKIDVQEKFIRNIGKEITLINDDIYYSAIEIKRLKTQMDTLKAQYAKIVVYAYKNRSNYDYLNFIFSAKSFNDAMKRVDGVNGELNVADYLAAKVSPVFFGSAINNFGVKEMLDTFIRIAPMPQSRETSERKVEVEEPKLSGFIFKIHANLDPKHRDRIAFFRVCSGRFERNKYFHHVRLDKDVRFSNPYSFLARDKSVIEDAYAGDVVGLFDTGNFKIGDTLTEGENFYFTGIPSFSPEIFKEVVNKDPMKTKQLEKGLAQLTDEGVAQLFTQFGGTKKIIGCVGELQFEVIQYRLLHEYGAAVEFRALPFYKATWLTSTDHKKLHDFVRFKQANSGLDKDGHDVYLAQSEWFLNTEISNNPDIQFHFTSEIHKGE